MGSPETCQLPISIQSWATCRWSKKSPLLVLPKTFWSKVIVKSSLS